MNPRNGRLRLFSFLSLLTLLSSACLPQAVAMPADPALQEAQPVVFQETPLPQSTPTAFYEPRPLYGPGELVDYTAQTGDTLPHLARRFNTTVAEILEANTFIPPSATTMPPGMPMKIPIYYLPLWGPSYQILPDSLFINGPSQVSFDTQKFVLDKPGWLNGYRAYVSGQNRSGYEIIDLVARNFSVSPRLLIALLEYHSGAITQSTLPPELEDFPLKYNSWTHKGLYLQLTWTANLLNNGFYAYRTDRLTEIQYPDGRLERFDPWLNASTASLHNYFNILSPSVDDYMQAISADGFAKVYSDLFGNPWLADEPHIPGSLVQPEFTLPFEPGSIWALTGGPHTGWGNGDPYAALDFAPPSKTQGCVRSEEWVTAVAPGVVARSETGVVVLDLDGDGDERTGWNLFYLHVGTEGRATLGEKLERGEFIGHPSCEGGTSTGTHVHVARKYNGEWIPADTTLAFNLEGWIAHNGSAVYLGTLTRFTQTVTACTCSNAASFIQTDRR